MFSFEKVEDNGPAGLAVPLLSNPYFASSTFQKTFFFVKKRNTT